ncbi:hypothetical protein L7F22_032097 [Adiantum nelumboides]|nr:hypothetical protein [Adiantum nelumboides]
MKRSTWWSIIADSGRDYTVVLDADAAYKARIFLVKPYRMKAGQFLQEKREFDSKLLKGRIKVENAFGLLKNRWRILRDLNVDLVFAPTMVGACCLLHNFVQLRGEAKPRDQDDPHPNSQDTLRNEGGNQQQREMALRTKAALFLYSSLREQNVE